MKHEYTAVEARSYELAAVSGAASAVLGLGTGMLFKNPGIGAVIGAGIGLLVRALVVNRMVHDRR
ncbi:hypothetical protein [uncultured Arthrobacter sp.]|uniref:hypothetical protein n=1 Tax=uncultured Arthrobacter sp. TaxID=114050 RepID=UPI002639C109|nr:hypothetical protein [uncultured Arthrobacter sp.]